MSGIERESYTKAVEALSNSTENVAVLGEVCTALMAAQAKGVDPETGDYLSCHGDVFGFDYAGTSPADLIQSLDTDDSNATLHIWVGMEKLADGSGYAMRAHRYFSCGEFKLGSSLISETALPISAESNFSHFSTLLAPTTKWFSKRRAGFGADMTAHVKVRNTDGARDYRYRASRQSLAWNLNLDYRLYDKEDGKDGDDAYSQSHPFGALTDDSTVWATAILPSFNKVVFHPYVVVGGKAFLKGTAEYTEMLASYGVDHIQLIPIVAFASNDADLSSLDCIDMLQDPWLDAASKAAKMQMTGGHAFSSYNSDSAGDTRYINPRSLQHSASLRKVVGADSYSTYMGYTYFGKGDNATVPVVRALKVKA